MKFCSNCGSDQIVFIIPEGDNNRRFVCNNCDTIFYQNPKIVVGCIPLYQDKILLCRRSIEPRFGFWNLPGGYMENGETVEEGAKRETQEEANVDITIRHLHSVFNLPTVNQVFLHFIATINKIDLSPTSESSELRLFNYDEIPWEELAFHSNKFALETFFLNKERNESKVHIGSFWK
ncbi:NUDIX hydrolase [Flexithrix dorotheae]|uniref:NUDIX hydrolase n=1 Tax=Flexithrix dorotheae TaxID=70993 RepID=UPI0003605637|nr:NUDIX hydrolase [Flexithrix dorotheae]